ncbi:MAG: zinc ABC transporter solute-binding protein [Bacteroidales bacterium]|nr:zinc ABC transporter solute-binding protein [Bacteroidales bacterium]
MRCFRVSLLILSLAVAVMAIVAGCVGNTSQATKIVTVTLPPQKYIVEQIAGDRLDVRCLLSNGANPETYDPTVTNMMNLDKSIAYLRIGNVGFEDAVLGKISHANPSLPIYDISEGIELITGTHTHYHAHDGETVEHDTPDPHTWTSVKNARVMAANVLSALKEIDPANTGDYNERYERFVNRLDSLDSAFSSRLEAAGTPSFIVWHPSLSYFARDYGLTQIVAGGSENKESSVTAVRQAIDKATETGAGVFFYQKDIDNRQLAALNSSIKATEVNINPLSADWEDEMIKIVDALTAK